MSQKTDQAHEPKDQPEPQHSPAEALAQGLIETMAEPSDHAIAQHLAEQAELENVPEIVDSNAEKFNPEIHAVNADGSPKFTATGAFAKKRGRRSGAASVLNAASDKGQSVKPDTSAVIRANKQAAAGSAAANTLIMLGMVLGGDEWRPLKDDKLGLDEKANLETAFQDYFTASNLEDLPPSFALGIAVLGYALPRFTMPKTQARTATLWGKCKVWWANRKLKKHGLKAEIAENDK